MLFRSFTSRDIRAAVFRCKKAHAPRAAPSAATPDRQGRYLYPFFEDLTSVTFAKMRAIAAHPSVEACWSYGGQLRFKMKGKMGFSKVHSVFDTVEKIVSQ